MFSRRPGARFNRGRVSVPQAAVASGDTTAPLLQSATIAADGLTIALLYDEALDTGSVPAAGAYTLGGTAVTVSSVGIASQTVTLTLAAPVLASATVTVSYTAGGSPVQDTSGNNAANLTTQATTNNSTATLLEVADHLGATLLLDFYTASSYTLSTSTLTAVNNRITDTALTVAGTPQYNATGLNSGPAVVFNGTTDYLTGTEAAVYNIWEDSGASTLIVVAIADLADATGTLFSCGNSGSTNSNRYFGQWNNASGKMRAVSMDDDATSNSVVGDDATSVATASIWEVTSNGTTLTARRNRVNVAGMVAQAFAPGTLSPDRYGVATWARTGETQHFDGNISLIVGLPTELSSGNLDILYGALAAHDAALAGLIP